MESISYHDFLASTAFDAWVVDMQPVEFLAALEQETRPRNPEFSSFSSMEQQQRRALTEIIDHTSL